MQERKAFRPTLDRLEDRAVPAGLPFGGFFVEPIKNFVQAATTAATNALGDQVGKSPDAIPQQQAALGLQQTTQAFINKVNTVLLGSPNAVSALPFYSPLTGGVTVRALGVARTMRSAEYVNSFVQDQYQHILGREPDPTGLALYTAPLQFGADQKTTTLSLASSDEFFIKSGNTNEGYVKNLYQTLLGRPASEADVATLTAGLNNGTMSRTQVASIVVYSAEYNTLLVTQMYQQILGRDPDPSGLATHVNLLNTGHREQAVMLALIMSDEFSAGLS